MCLYVITKKLIADTDIRCYKILSLKITSNKRLRLQSINYNKQWIPDRLYKLSKKIVIEKELGVRMINAGFHSFKYYNDAIIKSNLGKVAVACVIPKGAVYYEGTVNGRELGYVSNKIKILIP